MEGITSQWLLNQITNPDKKLVLKDELSKALLASDCRIKLLVGAGDIGAEVDKITKILEDEA